MEFQGAVVTRDNNVFAIVVVQEHVVNDLETARKAVSTFQKVFGKTPIVLMAIDEGGEPRWHGSSKHLDILSHSSLDYITWRRYPFPESDRKVSPNPGRFSLRKIM